MTGTLRHLFAVVVGAWAVVASGQPASPNKDAPWATEFSIDPASFTSVGRNSYFILEPGYYVVLRGGGDQVTMTVLDETRRLAGVETRVIEERELSNGKLVEISRNYFAINKLTHDVLYFGEEVSMYRNGKVVSREGSWLAGVDQARAGLMMPGQVRVGLRHYQEQAPGVAMDRAEILSTGEQVSTPAGKFDNCVKVEETTSLSSAEREYKYYAEGIGLVKYERMLLVDHGVRRSKKGSRRT